MQKISALFNKPPRECKNKDNTDVGDYAHHHHYDSSNDGGSSSRVHPRLVRSPVIRGLRQPENVDLSGVFLNGTHHSTEANAGLHHVPSMPNLSSTHPANFKVASPLPSPPRSPVRATGQATTLWPLPAPRQPYSKRTEDIGKSLNGNFSEYLEDGQANLLDGEMQKPLLSTENNQRLSSSNSPSVGGMPGNLGGHLSHTGGLPFRNVKFEGGGNDYAYMYTKQAESIVPNDPFSSGALRSPHESERKKDTRIWKHDVFNGELTSADEYAEHSSIANYSHQNGTPSWDARQSNHHSQRIGTPTPLSPPLFPSGARPLSPGGWMKGHLLGSGAFGKVYKGIHSETGEFCAIKEVEFVENDQRSKESLQQLEKEIISLSTLQHPNIVQYKGSERVGDSLYIYLELISGGSLYKLYQEFKKLEEPVIRRYTRQILHGLKYLHVRKIVHRDIKCANILVDQDGTIKLADFGVSKYIKEQGTPFSLKGSPYWMAPEVILSMNVGYEYAVDIWSLGCTVIEMVTGKPPWSDLEPAAAMFKVTKVGKPPIPKGLSPDGQSFLRLCLQKNPADRPTAAALLEHPFVRIPKDASHIPVHAFDAQNPLDLGGLRLAFPSTHPSLSAPSSPKSLHRPGHELASPESNFVSSLRYTDTVPSMAEVEQRWDFRDNSILQQKSPRKSRKKGQLSFESRRSHEFAQTQARSSLSAPGSPKAAQSMYGGLYPIRSSENLAGYPTSRAELR